VDAIALSPDGRELAALLPPQGTRFLLGLAGPPGAGKSTLAAAIAAQTGAPVVPMDGFHLADVELARRGTLHQKGAPETFDAWGYAALLSRLRAGVRHEVLAPAFEREELEQPIAGAISVPPDAGLVVTEGNYLLLDQPPWRAVREQLDAVWFLHTPEPRRLAMLIERHVATGKTHPDARRWVARVDRPNARLVEESAHRADLVLDLTAWRWP
jgi:pantothenate kinase